MTEDRYGDPEDCNDYYECDNGIYIPRSCYESSDTDYLFNVYEGRCEDGGDPANCQWPCPSEGPPYTGTPAESGQHYAFFGRGVADHPFYHTFPDNGHVLDVQTPLFWKLRDLLSFFFVWLAEPCDEHVEECRESSVEGEQFPDQHYCENYYTCVNGSLEGPEACPQGQLFDAVQLASVIDLNRQTVTNAVHLLTQLLLTTVHYTGHKHCSVFCCNNHRTSEYAS